MSQMHLIAAAAANRESYSRIVPFERDIVWNPLHKKVWEVIGEYYERDPEAQDIDLEILKGLLKSRYPRNASDWDLYQFSKVSEPNLLEMVRSTVRQSHYAKLHQAINDEDFASADELLVRLVETPTDLEEEDVVNDAGLDFLSDVRDKSDLVPIGPRWLNDQLGGGVPPGTQIGLFGRPDAGKTVCGINQAAVAARAGHKVMYLSNEDPVKVLMLRLMCSFTRMTKEEVLAKPEEAYNLAVERGWKNLYFKPITPGTIKEIYSLVEKHKPKLLIVDQVRNLSVYGSDSLTEVLTKAPIKLRDIAKKYGLVSLLITQAGESAHGKLVLDMTDVEYSNTGFAAQLDLLIGVGQNADYHRDGYVSWSFPKNKFTGPIEPQMFRIDYARNAIRDA